MARFSQLPPEIVVQIFETLKTIDDALHLGRACRVTHDILDKRRHCIMKSIIVSSEIHRYDARLCYLNDLFQRFRGNESRRQSRESYDSARHGLPPEDFFALKTATLSDSQVWDVVARWGGLRVIQDLYTTPEINRQFAESGAFEDLKTHFKDPLDPFVVPTETDNSEKSRISQHHRTTLSPSDSARFYTALTGYWLAAASERMFGCFKFGTVPLQDSAVDVIEEEYWKGGMDRTAQECLDVLEVFEFTAGFLGLRTVLFQWDTIWGLDDGWGVYDYDHDRINEVHPQNMAKVFANELSQRLDPSDVIHLLCLTVQKEGIKAAGKPLAWFTNTMNTFLRSRGYAVPGWFHYLDDAPILGSENPPLRILEDAVEVKLVDLCGPLVPHVRINWSYCRKWPAKRVQQMVEESPIPTTCWAPEIRGSFSKLNEAMVLNVEPKVIEECRVLASQRKATNGM